MGAHAADGSGRATDQGRRARGDAPRRAGRARGRRRRGRLSRRRTPHHRPDPARRRRPISVRGMTMTEILEIETVTVRNLRHTDLPDVVRIDALASGRNRPHYFELMLMRALNFAGLQMSLVAELDGRIAGYLIVSLYYGEYGLAEPTASIDAVGVAPALRRQRVAHA